MRRILIYSTLIVVVYMASCSKSSDPVTPHSCDISTAGFTAPAAGTVKYEAQLTGAGTINKVVIKNALGVDSVINSPGISFQTTITVTNGKAINISATGQTEGGTIEISYEFQASGGGSVIKNEQDCGN